MIDYVKILFKYNVNTSLQNYALPVR